MSVSERRLQYLREYKARKREERRALLLLGKSCERCHESDPKQLTFHHVDDGRTKEFTIRRELGNLSLRRIREELEKCECLCRCCHIAHHRGYGGRPHGLDPWDDGEVEHMPDEDWEELMGKGLPVI